MLFVTFHGSGGGIKQVVAFDTDDGSVLNADVLGSAPGVALDELRAAVFANGYLYVANGGHATSNVLCYAPPTAQSPTTCPFVSTVVAATTTHDKDHFETSIAHPFGLAFDDSGNMFVSNQDTNVVAKVGLSQNHQVGTLGSGCQSAYLSKKFPSPAVFLDGTYVASQSGKLKHVTVAAPDVPYADGGLKVVPASGPAENSVRDIAIANGFLFVCDEPDNVVNVYSLADGSFLCHSNALSDKPTHVTSWAGGLYVSAGASLYWSHLPKPGSSPSTFALQQIALAVAKDTSIGGISFNTEGGTSPFVVYVPFQQGKGKTGTGSIESYTVTQSSASALPVFTDPTVLVASAALHDTPEFVLYVADPTT